KAHGLNCYKTYGPDFMSHDLGHYLGPDYAGETLDRYVLPEPKPRMPLYHLVGALDPLTDADIKHRINDGLPETLGEWIRADGLTHLKIKLNGDDLGWDVDRVVGVDRGGVQGVQGADADGAVGGGGAEAGDVPVRAGPVVPRGVADPLGGDRGARPRGGGDRGEQPAVLPGGERGLGADVPRRVHRP